MTERRVERHEAHEVEREEDVAPGSTTSSVSVGPDEITKALKQDAVEVVGGELEELGRPETIRERRSR